MIEYKKVGELANIHCISEWDRCQVEEAIELLQFLFKRGSTEVKDFEWEDVHMFAGCNGSIFLQNRHEQTAAYSKSDNEILRVYDCSCGEEILGYENLLQHMVDETVRAVVFGDRDIKSCGDFFYGVSGIDKGKIEELWEWIKKEMKECGLGDPDPTSLEELQGKQKG